MGQHWFFFFSFSSWENKDNGVALTSYCSYEHLIIISGSMMSKLSEWTISFLIIERCFCSIVIFPDNDGNEYCDDWCEVKSIKFLQMGLLVFVNSLFHVCNECFSISINIRNKFKDSKLYLSHMTHKQSLMSRLARFPSSLSETNYSQSNHEEIPIGHQKHN